MRALTLDGHRSGPACYAFMAALGAVSAPETAVPIMVVIAMTSWAVLGVTVHARKAGAGPAGPQHGFPHRSGNGQITANGR
jgi:hypothetical protein